MTLPASGQLGMSDIRNELQVISQSPFSITDAVTGVYATLNICSPVRPNASTPHAISEWYSYCHLCACKLFCVTSGSTSCDCTGCCTNCAPGYIPLNDGTQNCVLSQTCSPTNPTNPYTITHYQCTSTQQSVFTSTGTLFHQSITIGGDATVLYTGTTANIWKNDLGNQCDYGPLLRQMVWTQSGSAGTPTDRWICHNTCITGSTGTTKTYYIGIGADVGFRVLFDGVEKINTYNGPYGARTIAAIAAFPLFWHVYPLDVPAGIHTVSFCGYSSGTTPTYDVFGAEIYDNTFQSLTAATSLNALNRVYQTVNFTGQNFTSVYTTGTGSTTLDTVSGYTCSSDVCTYNPCYGTCYQTITCTPAGSATPTPTMTVTPTITPTITTTPTITPTVTPTVTPTTCVVTIIFENINAKGVTFDSADVDTNAVTYSSGTNFPIGNELSGTFTTQFTGTLPFTVCYTNNDDGAYKMYFDDCNTTSFCCNIQPNTSDCCNFSDVVFDCNCTITVKLEQGNC